MKTIRIGSGAGFAGDRIEPAVKLAEKGNIHYLGFGYLAERTIALAQAERLRDPDAGFDPLLVARMRAVLRPIISFPLEGAAKGLIVAPRNQIVAGGQQKVDSRIKSTR